MIHTHLQTGSTWAFATPFHWSVWVALGGTTVIVGILVGLTERLHKGIKANPKGGCCEPSKLLGGVPAFRAILKKQHRQTASLVYLLPHLLSVFSQHVWYVEHGCHNGIVTEPF
jgi:hypothetical protein